MTSSDDKKAVIDEIVHGTFVKEGVMVAFPLCFPGATTPITAAESHITALDATADGVVYGGTSGRLTHVFVGMFNGVTGIVFDMGTVEGADHCAAICCGQEYFVACVNGPGGGRILRHKLQPLPFDLIQEWAFSRQPFEDLGEAGKCERIVHAVTDLSRRFVIGTTDTHLFRVDLESGQVEVMCELLGAGRLGVGSKGGTFGLDEGNHLWRCNATTGAVMRKDVKLPPGSWDNVSLIWARDRVDGTLYTADAEGNLFAFTEERGFSKCLGRTRLAPVGPMAATFDGRVFGTCGEEISRLFCYDTDAHELTDIGVAVSVIERRRYGYVFGDAVTGRDGQVFFGEDDDLGHLWLYFPRIKPRRN